MSNKSINLICILIVLSLGIFSGYISNSGVSSWYHSLNKPSLNPPAFIFGPTWTILYILLGLALAKIWQLRHENLSLLVIFIIQLALNMIWSPLFFMHHQISLALIDLIALWIFVMILLISTIRNLEIFWLILPYGLWISFAMYLNYQIWMLN